MKDFVLRSLETNNIEKLEILELVHFLDDIERNCILGSRVYPKNTEYYEFFKNDYYLEITPQAKEIIKPLILVKFNIPGDYTSRVLFYGFTESDYPDYKMREYVLVDKDTLTALKKYIVKKEGLCTN